MTYEVRIYHAFADLPDCYGELFKRAGQGNYYGTLSWFDNQARTTNQKVRLYGVETSEPQSAEALYVTRETHAWPWGRGLAGQTSMYTIVYSPIERPGADNSGDLAAAFAQKVASEIPRFGVIQFDAMDRDGAAYKALVETFRAQGLAVATYFHFGNQFEDVSHGSFDEYLRRRPSALRNTLKRKRKKLEKTAKVRIEILDGAENLEEFMTAYDQIYTESWKEAEPFPDFTSGLVETAAAAGALRAGALYVDEKPAAAQIWIVAGGQATIFKLAYDEQFAKLSVGSILTAEIMRHVIESERVHVVDFGRGDDPYKATWLAKRKEHWGILAFNPRTLAGLLGATRHLGAQVVKRAVRAIRERSSQQTPDD